MNKLITIFLFSIFPLSFAHTIIITDPHTYFEHYGKIYYGPNKNVKVSVLLWDADVRTFEDMGYGYARDYKRFYHRGKEMHDVSPEGIRIEKWYAVSRSVVYCDGKRVKGASPASFEVIDNPYNWKYGKDKKHIYIETRRTPFDVLTFKILENEYISNKDSLYYGVEGRKVEDAIPGDISFKDEFLISNGNVYLRGYKTKYDVNTFDVLFHYKFSCIGRGEDDGFLISDKDSIYLLANCRKSFDKKDFRLLGERFFKDKENVYFYPYYGERLNKLDLTPDETQGIKITLSSSKNNYKPALYIIGDNNMSYSFTDMCGEYLERQRGIDINTFNIYIKLNNKVFFRDDYSFYKLGDMNTLHKLNVYGEGKIDLVNYDITRGYICLKNDEKILYPFFTPSIDAATFVFVPQRTLNLPQLKDIYDDVYMDKNGFYDRQGYSIDGNISEEDYHEILKQLDSPEEWETKRKATLEDCLIVRYPK